MPMKSETLKDLTDLMVELEHQVQNIRKEILLREASLNEKLTQIRDIRAVINKQSARAIQKTHEKQQFLHAPIDRDMKFRDIIRKAMEGVREPIRPKDLAAKLKEAGIKQTGKSDLSTRVGVELSKLSKIGELVRVDGKYLPAKH